MLIIIKKNYSEFLGCKQGVSPFAQNYKRRP